VEITAPGYLPYRMTFSADRDVALAVSLDRDNRERGKRRRQKSTADDPADPSPVAEPEAGGETAPPARVTAQPANTPGVEHDTASADPWATDTRREPTPSTDDPGGQKVKERPRPKAKDDPSKWADPFEEERKEKPKPAAWTDPFE
jgi:hypothetical protein